MRELKWEYTYKGTKNNKESTWRPHRLVPFRLEREGWNNKTRIRIYKIMSGTKRANKKELLPLFPKKEQVPKGNKIKLVCGTTCTKAAEGLVPARCTCWQLGGMECYGQKFTKSDHRKDSRMSLSDRTIVGKVSKITCLACALNFSSWCRIWSKTDVFTHCSLSLFCVKWEQCYYTELLPWINFFLQAWFYSLSKQKQFSVKEFKANTVDFSSQRKSP